MTQSTEPIVDNSLRLEIPLPILDYAKFTYHYYVPRQRRSGFTEINDQKRGEGDYYDLIGKLTIFDYLASTNKVSSMELSVGLGDSYDISTRTKDIKLTWNIKTSKYAPYASRLSLFVKKEELSKNIDGYIQVFVHLDEQNDPIPHIHVAGFIHKGSYNWNTHSKIITIPKTNHLGIKIPIVALDPFQVLVDNTDDKF